MLRSVASSALIISFGLAFLLAGCLPRTTVVSNPGPADKGIRYYRPKPYLLVQPVESDVAGSEVAIELQYLPDFSEEYSIHVRSGFGVNNTKITLDQGWNLVAIDQELDSKVAEQIEAVGKLLDGVGNIVPTAKNVPPPSPRMVVNATNVPIGFYESVIGCGPNGRKQLMGWRYVGFAPYQSCPLASAGGNALPCESAFVYGLVYRNGVMVFEPLGEIGERGVESIKATETERASASAEGLSNLHPIVPQIAAVLRDTTGVSLPPTAIVVVPESDESGLRIHLNLNRRQGESFGRAYAQHGREVDESLNRLVRQFLLDAGASARLSWNVSGR